MSNPKPLQAGDSLQGVTSSAGTMWRTGQLAPVGTTPAPIHSGSDDQVHELNTKVYGDAYDPTAPMRVRDVSREWTLDSDEDGHKN